MIRPMSQHNKSNSPLFARPGHRTGARALAASFILLALALTAAFSASAVRVLIVDGSWALLILAGAGGWGVGPALLLGLPTGGAAWAILGAIGLGLGILAALGLALGSLGVFSAGVWWGVLLAGLAFDAIVLARKGRAMLDRPPGNPIQHAAWIILVLAPFLSLGILCAATPPGVLWAEEGRGYDVLEYHLAVPREHLDNGRIAYLPHNVYASFPANVETLYLWTMVLRGEPIEAMYSAKVLNLLLGVLAVWAAFLAGRELGRRAALVAALLMGGVGWLVYLSGVAYVENGLLFFGTLAIGALLRCRPNSTPPHGRWALTAGLMAGLSCGCKYSAIGMIAMPIGLILAARSFRAARTGRMALVAFLGATVLALSPWLIRNAIQTGDPVFPLGAPIVGDYPPGWDELRAEHFAESHRPSLHERPLWDRAQLLWHRVIYDESGRRTGIWLWVLGLSAVWVCRRDQHVLALAAILAVQLAAWMFASHLLARFAVPMLIPLVLLAARLTEVFRARLAGRVFLAVVCAGLANNLFFITRLYADHLYPRGKPIPIHGLDAKFMEENWPGLEYLAALNRLPHRTRLLMVGDARGYYVRPTFDYCVVFNRNPFAEYVERRTGPDDVLRWLRQEKYSHVFVNWTEIDRLRRSSYGFAPSITRDLFDQLLAAGLKRIDGFRLGPSGTPYGELYQVPPS